MDPRVGAQVCDAAFQKGKTQQQQAEAEQGQQRMSAFFSLFHSGKKGHADRAEQVINQRFDVQAGQQHQHGRTHVGPG